MEYEEIGSEDLHLFHLIKWSGIVNAVMKFRNSHKTRNFVICWPHIAYKEGLHCVR